MFRTVAKHEDWLVGLTVVVVGPVGVSIPPFSVLHLPAIKEVRKSEQGEMSARTKRDLTEPYRRCRLNATTSWPTGTDTRSRPPSLRVQCARPEMKP